MDPLSLLWLYFIIASLQPVLQRQWLASQRRYQLSRLSRARTATVIVGQRDVVARAARTPDTSRRHSRLGARLQSS